MSALSRAERYPGMAYAPTADPTGLGRCVVGGTPLARGRPFGPTFAPVRGDWILSGARCQVGLPGGVTRTAVDPPARVIHGNACTSGRSRKGTARSCPPRGCSVRPRLRRTVLGE